MQPIQNISAEGPKGWSVGGWTGKGAEEKRGCGGGGQGAYPVLLLAYHILSVYSRKVSVLKGSVMSLSATRFVLGNGPGGLQRTKVLLLYATWLDPREPHSTQFAGRCSLLR